MGRRTVCNSREFWWRGRKGLWKEGKKSKENAFETERKTWIINGKKRKKDWYLSEWEGLQKEEGIKKRKKRVRYRINEGISKRGRERIRERKRCEKNREKEQDAKINWR